MPEKQLVILDWNGTTQNDVSFYYEYSACRVLARYGLPSLSLDEYRAEVSAVDFMEFLWRRGVPRTVTMDDIFAASRQEILKDRQSAELFPEVPAVLKRLREAGVTTTIVSMAPTDELTELLDGHHIGWEFAIISGDVHMKAEMFRAHCELLGISTARAIAVGDMVDDARAAATVGITPILCPRGYHTRERIEAARAEIPQIEIVDTLDGIFDHLR